MTVQKEILSAIEKRKQRDRKRKKLMDLVSDHGNKFALGAGIATVLSVCASIVSILNNGWGFITKWFGH